MLSPDDKLKQTRNMLFIWQYEIANEKMIVYPKFELELDTIPRWMLIESCGQACELFSRVCLNKSGEVYLTQLEDVSFTQLKNTTDSGAIIYVPELVHQFGEYVQIKVSIYKEEKQVSTLVYTHYYYKT